MKKIILKSLYHFLAWCSRVYIWRTKPTIIGVTGSVGKTTCRMILAEVLEKIQRADETSSGKRKKKKALRVYSSPKNFNTELGLVFSIFCIEEYHPSIKNLFRIALKVLKEALFSRKKYDVLIAEYGIDRPKDMEFLLKIARPDIAVLTKLGSVHADNFPGGTGELWQEKWHLLLAAKKKVYLNLQDSFSCEHIDLLSIAYTEIFSKEIPAELTLSDAGEFEQSWIYEKKKLSLNILGKEEQEYVNLGFQIAKDLGIKCTKQEYDFKVELLPGRFGVFQGGENIYIDSSYNASPEAMKKLIENTKVIHREMYPAHSLIYVLGDMREIGEGSGKLHKNLVPLVGDAEALMTVGPQMYQHFIPALKEASYKGDSHSSLSSRELGVYLKKYLSDHKDKKYLILFKGSENTIFLEETLAQLLTPVQQRRLIRQSESWKQKKDRFFKSL